MPSKKMENLSREITLFAEELSSNNKSDAAKYFSELSQLILNSETKQQKLILKYLRQSIQLFQIHPFSMKEQANFDRIAALISE